MIRRLTIVAICLSWLSIANAPRAFGQGLIWKLPADGTWVKYEGTYKQIEARPTTGQADLEIEWIQYLTIKSVGSEEAEVEGMKVPCRWLEFKAQIGKRSAAGINPGPVGQTIYKVLVPEHRVIGKLADDETIPVSFLSIVKGYRKDGEKDIEPIKGSVLQIYPKIALIRHYNTLERDGDQPEELQIGVGAVVTEKWKGKHEAENPTNHTLHEAELWRSNNVPFGLAQWNVKIVLERKNDKDPRSAFKLVSQSLVEMKAQETGTDAKSELAP